MQKLLTKILDLDQRFIFDPSKNISNKNRPFALTLSIFTELGSSLGALIIIITISAIFGWEFFFVAAPIYLFQLIAVELIKKLFKKDRPKEHKKNIFGILTKSASFPSGHTSNAFTMAFIISNYFPGNIMLTIIVFTIAGLIAFTRLLTGSHFYIDIVAGAISGLVLGVTGLLLWTNTAPLFYGII